MLEGFAGRFGGLTSVALRTSINGCKFSQDGWDDSIKLIESQATEVLGLFPGILEALRFCAGKSTCF